MDDVASSCRDEAQQLLSSMEVIDLHIDSMIPHRLFGYDLNRAHAPGLGWFFGHLDFPRAISSGLTGGMWSITTNPARSRRGRWRALLRNLDALQAAVAHSQGALSVVRNHREWTDARAQGAHGCLPAIQGGNALEGAPDGVLSIPDDLITRVTLVHLTNSIYGPTSSPLVGWRRGEGLTDAGRSMVEQLNERRIFVDLAHIGERAFWDAVQAHDASQPLIVTHTGVQGVKPHWRNLTDEQIRAVVDTGGVVGVMLQQSFLKRPGGPNDVDMVLEHMEHIASVAGPDAVALGTDYDGAIVPPPDLRDGSAPLRLVEAMVRRGWREEDIRGAMGQNFLRSFQHLRP